MTVLFQDYNKNVETYSDYIISSIQHEYLNTDFVCLEDYGVAFVKIFDFDLIYYYFKYIIEHINNFDREILLNSKNPDFTLFNQRFKEDFIEAYLDYLLMDLFNLNVYLENKYSKNSGSQFFIEDAKNWTIWGYKNDIRDRLYSIISLEKTYSFI